MLLSLLFQVVFHSEGIWYLNFSHAFLYWASLVSLRNACSLECIPPPPPASLMLHVLSCFLALVRLIFAFSLSLVSHLSLLSLVFLILLLILRNSITFSVSSSMNDGRQF